MTTTFFNAKQHNTDQVIVAMTSGHCYNDLVCVAQIRLGFKADQHNTKQVIIAMTNGHC